MKVGFYPKLAVMGILKNRRLYVPYILTCIGMVMMQYIITFLSLSPIIGSMEKNCNTVLKSKLVSHIHACITRDNGEYYVEDMNSTNGTYVNGERLIMNSRREINNLDEITLAAVSYVVEMS